MIYRRPQYLTTSRFNKALLPPVKDYLTQQGMTIKGRTLWVKIRCPFHDDHDPSLSINTNTGAFKCFVCDAKGGDLIAFHMQLHGIGFVDACKQLNIWVKT